MLLSVAARQIVRVRGHGAASVRRLGKKDVGLGTGWVAGRAQSVSQSVSQSLQCRSYQVRPKVRSWEGAHGGSSSSPLPEHASL